VYEDNRRFDVKKVRLLGISASPRRGNSLYYLNEALKCLPDFRIPVESTTYSFHKRKFEGCTGCLSCYRNGGKCILQDDFEELRQMWIKADAIVYSVPVYVVSIPGQLKNFIDRLHNSFWGLYDVPSMRHLKAIGFIAQGNAMYGGQDLAIQTLIMHTTLINSIAVAPDGSYIGAGGWTGNDNSKSASLKRAEQGSGDVALTIDVARSVVQRVVEVAAIVKAGVLALSDIFQADPRYNPLLARLSAES
jgi:multimeric flavodoxin WrbA